MPPTDISVNGNNNRIDASVNQNYNAELEALDNRYNAREQLRHERQSQKLKNRALGILTVNLVILCACFVYAIYLRSLNEANLIILGASILTLTMWSTLLHTLIILNLVIWLLNLIKSITYTDKKKREVLLCFLIFAVFIFNTLAIHLDYQQIDGYSFFYCLLFAVSLSVALAACFTNTQDFPISKYYMVAFSLTVVPTILELFLSPLF